MTGPRRPPRPDRGTGLIGTVAGATTFLVLLTVALQILLQLLAASTVEAAAYEAARDVATADRAIDPVLLADSEQHARTILGGLGEGATFEWDTSDPATVELTVTTPAPRLLVPILAGALGWERIERRAVVRREAVQA